MTTEDLAYHVIRHCDPRDLSVLTMAQKVELASAMSFALIEFYTFAPDNTKRTTASVSLDAPTTVQITVTKGSVEVEEFQFDSHLHGSTIVIGGHRNEINSSSTLLDAHLGDSGTQEATIYNDSVPLGRNRQIQRLSSDPWVLTDGSGNVSFNSRNGLYQGPYQLCRVDRDHAPLSGFFQNYWGYDRISSYNNWSYGEPTHYALVETGNSQNAQDHFIIKVSPAPNRELVLRFNLEIDPEKINWASITHFPIELPISDAQFHGIIAPMVEHELLASTIFKGDQGIRGEIKDRYSRARAMISKIPRDRAPTQNMIETPMGY